jgi:uncharacterized protein (TIGR03663 family)
MMTSGGHAADTPQDCAWETYDVALWAVVAGLALAMRLAQLDAAPLGAAEARQATLAWQAATGHGTPAADYSPLLLAANSLFFTLFGASDALARLWPAVFGSALTLTPLLLRQRLGRVGALASGLYLAISPTALIASRQLDGTTMAAAGAMAFVGALSRFLQTERRGWLWFGAVSLSFAVASGAAAYGVLVPLALAWVVASQLGSGGYGSRAARELTRLGPHAAEFTLLVVLSAIAFSTGLGWNLSGMGAIGSVAVDWLGRYVGVGTGAASPLTLLAVYELFGVVFGLGGLIWGLRRGRHWSAVLGLWGGVGLLLLAIMPGRTPTDLIWVVLPLAMLAGLAVQAVAQDRWWSGATMRSVYAVLVLILWSQAYLMLARYAAFGERTDLTVVGLVVGLQVLLGLSFGFVVGLGATVRTAAAATGVTLLALTISAAWGVAYRRPADPREALISEPTALNVRDLVGTLRELSWQQTGMPTTLQFVYEAPSESVLAWYLRDFEMARRVERLSELGTEEMGPIVVSAGADEAAIPLSLSAEYTGQDFTLRRQWTPSSMGCRFWESGCSIAFDWFLFRDGPPLPEANGRATLWRRVELVDRDS